MCWPYAKQEALLRHNQIALGIPVRTCVDGGWLSHFDLDRIRFVFHTKSAIRCFNLAFFFGKTFRFCPPHTREA